MLIGIMSDSHDDMAMIRKATDFFNNNKVDHVIHAGDVVSPFTFEILKDLDSPFTGIFGNNDGDRVLLKEKSNGAIQIQPHMFELGGRKFALVHEPDAVEALAASQMYDIVIYGHTHRPIITKQNNTMILNPGKTARLHKGTATVALLNTETLQAELVELENKD
jgi:putative phosphoesterase